MLLSFLVGSKFLTPYKDYELKSLDLVEILCFDAVTKAVLSVWELLLEWWLDSNSNVTMELRQKAGRLIKQRAAQTINLD